MVSTRRAWHDSAKLTQDVLDTYQRPLRVQHWDTALAEVFPAILAGSLCYGSTAYHAAPAMLSYRRGLQVSRLKREVSPEQLQTLYSACARLPALVATGAQDGIVPRAQVQSE